MSNKNRSTNIKIKPTNKTQTITTDPAPKPEAVEAAKAEATEAALPAESVATTEATKGKSVSTAKAVEAIKAVADEEVKSVKTAEKVSTAKSVHAINTLADEEVKSVKTAEKVSTAKSVHAINTLADEEVKSIKTAEKVSTAKSVHAINALADEEVKSVKTAEKISTSDAVRAINALADEEVKGIKALKSVPTSKSVEAIKALADEEVKSVKTAKIVPMAKSAEAIKAVADEEVKGIKALKSVPTSKSVEAIKALADEEVKSVKTAKKVSTSDAVRAINALADEEVKEVRTVGIISTAKAVEAIKALKNGATPDQIAVKTNTDPIEPMPREYRHRHLLDWFRRPRRKIRGEEDDGEKYAIKKAVSLEGFITLFVVLAIFIPIAIIMGFGNMLNTLFNNALDLLLNTCFYLLGVAVVIGALSSVLTEFGVIALANKALSPLMKPLYGMPGATSVAIFSTFLSDNPAVLTLADDVRYRKYFKKYQLAGLTNLGTAFGMGLIVVITMASQPISGKGSVPLAVAMGVVGAIIGSIFATRLMLHKSKKLFGKDEDAVTDVSHSFDAVNQREVRKGGFVQRFFDSLLEGGASGVKIGMAIIPGVLIIANIVMLLSDGAGDGGVYTGAAGEGVGLLPWIGDKLSIILNPIFGFESSSAISVPITALGSAGAALGVVKGQTFTATEIAVFTSMCMFWSGYLSTHVAMMDSLGFRKLTTSSILYHTLGGVVAGFCAHWLYALFALLL